MSRVLAGNVALVTGAGRGIGLAAAKALTQAGASVVVADRDAEAIGTAAERLRSAGHNAIAVTCDVTDKAQVAARGSRLHASANPKRLPRPLCGFAVLPRVS